MIQELDDGRYSDSRSVDKNVEITESVGAVAPSGVKKLVALDETPQESAEPEELSRRDDNGRTPLCYEVPRTSLGNAKGMNATTHVVF
jgi:hypothetical protein